MLGERLRVEVRPELPQEAGGALDVREQERHRPGGQVPRHAPSIADDFAQDAWRLNLMTMQRVLPVIAFLVWVAPANAAPTVSVQATPTLGPAPLEATLDH